jgi:cell division protein FtsW (lipid II flippase)
MDIKFLLFSILLLGFAVLAIASNSIAIKCANENATWKEGQKVNFQFLISQLVSAILMVLCAFAGIYMAIKAGGAVEEAVNGNM